MRWTPRAIRVGVVISLVLPAFVILMTSSLQAQFPKGGPKPPPFQPPKFETVWICPNFKCKKEIGKPPTPPPATCPFCGTKILNGVGPANPVNPQPQPNPFPPPQPVNPNPGQKGLAGTSWSGSETLAGYGALTFQFQPGGQATMIDKDGNLPGNWSQGGNSITINFPNQGVTYNGTITGGQMSGTARNGKDNWSWTVSNAQFNLAANPPVNPAPINPQPINPIANPTPQPFVPPPVSAPAPPPAKAPPAAEPQNAAVDSPRPSRIGLIAVLVGVVFVGLGLAVLGGGIIFIVKAMK